MADNSYFTNLRSYFHTFSRAFSMKGQNFVDQAPLKSGHNLTTSDIRAEEIPFIDASYKDVEEESVITGNVGSRTVIEKYEGVLKFYDGVALTVMPNTNNETYRLVVDDETISGFIDPTDKFSEDGSATADGYAMSLLDSSGNKIPAKAGQTWTFDPYNGTVQFANGEGPTNHAAWGTIKIRAFAYVGKKLNTKMAENNTAITNTMPAIKPFEWSANGDSPDMTLVTDNDGKSVSNIVVPKGARYIVIDAILFNVFSAHMGLAYGALYYLSGDDAGKTLVVFEDWDDEYFVTGKDQQQKNVYGNSYAARFVGYGFVKTNGSVLTILERKSISPTPV